MRTHGQREGSITCWGWLLRVARGGTVGGRVGTDNVGRNVRYRRWGEAKQSTLPCAYLRNCLACSAHVPQNLKSNTNLKKKERNRNFI